ncbi:hypothetical protein ACHAXA_006822 [Cyclostephanos tholiformis]|uniref:Magnesium transporter n=1 Tax=Cyclostephanos tholiformis TaxID=382380 RepID=A0ABD3R5X0_9STRA
MTLRSLYNSVVRAITDNCRDANDRTRGILRGGEQMQMQQRRPPPPGGNIEEMHRQWMNGAGSGVGIEMTGRVDQPQQQQQQRSGGGGGDEDIVEGGVGNGRQHLLPERDEEEAIVGGGIRTGIIGHDNESGPRSIIDDRHGGCRDGIDHREGSSGDDAVVVGDDAGTTSTASVVIGPTSTTAMTSPPPPTTPSDDFVDGPPPHYLPSLTSPNDVVVVVDASFPTPPVNPNRSPSVDDDGRVGGRPLQHQPIQRPARQSRSDTSSIIMRNGSIGGGGGRGGGGANGRATYRERLGGYLHPRDMRRLVTPFSSSNEPQLIVRRHAMLLNFDPLRAIVLKDRLFVLVPDGADSMLIALEGRVRGGIAEMTDQVFGGVSEHDVPPVMMPNNNNKMSKSKSREALDDFYTKGEDYSDIFPEDVGNDEWQDIQRMDWQKLPFELQSVDAILQTITSMLMDDVRKVHHGAERAMGELRGEAPNRKKGGGALTEYSHERLRLHKDEVNLMDRRVRGFIRAINQVLDEDEDMALMNLSRLLTHPERFMQPVPQEVLEEESDEPELILETHLQQALSIVNTLDLLKGQIMTTQEQISMTLDALRNRLLFINTLLSLASLCVTIGSFIGSLFGMNITNPLQDMPDSTNFLKVVWVTSASVTCLCGILAYIFYRVTNTPTFKYFPGSGNITRAPSVQMLSSYSSHFHHHEKLSLR